nr:hypothetical protein [Tanacetum cinerariifolium]
ADDQPIVQSSQHPEWFSQPKKPPTSNRDWNKTLPAIQGSTQTWISELEKQADSRSSFNELLDTPLDFSNFPELVAGPTFELMKGSCTSLIKLEYHLEEVYKVTTDQLDWVNPEGQSSLDQPSLYLSYSLFTKGRYDVYVPTLHKRPRGKQDQYAVSREDQYTIFKVSSPIISTVCQRVIPQNVTACVSEMGGRREIHSDLTVYTWDVDPFDLGVIR